MPPRNPSAHDQLKSRIKTLHDAATGGQKRMFAQLTDTVNNRCKGSPNSIATLSALTDRVERGEFPSFQHFSNDLYTSYLSRFDRVPGQPAPRSLPPQMRYAMSTGSATA